MMLVRVTNVTKVLEIFKHNPMACTFSIAFGILIMLSVAYLDPSESSAIRLRHAVGSVLLLLPGMAQRMRTDEDSE